MLKNRIFIGRNEENDIVVPAVFNVVSGSHADLKLLDSGEYLYCDHSTNGSTVKGKRIRNESVTVPFGTPIILATRFALDWERVRELLPPPAPGAAPAPGAEPPASAPTQLRGSHGASDWHPSHPADLTSNIPQAPQPAYDRRSRIDSQEMPQGAPGGKHRRTFDLNKGYDEDDPRATRRSSDAAADPRATRMSSEPAADPRATRLSSDSGQPLGMRSHFQSLGLRAGDMFAGRFLLVRNIGAGASATVWEAQDTKTGGLKVAIKIFSLKHGMDSYGFQNLQREFTTVFNFAQQYLLTPSFYDVCEGCPYLVMRYCERGSAAKLIGKATEAQVIKLLHDVACGLEYLHDKKIIHQDIKPDNILQADNGDFMITDFGISATIDALNGDAGMSGGTRAYMGPERFNGGNESASDVWSLGATAYELVTGDAPYGDNGGMMQAYGNAVPPIAQKLQPEVKDIIMRCLEKDPAKRPTAAEIRKKIDIYYETGGSWTRKNNAKLILLIAAAAAAVLLAGAGIWIWDYNRVKTSYYAEVTEVYGVPQGVGKTVKHDKRAESFMLQKQRGKVVRMANVNSAGKVVGFNDTERQLRYYPEMRYEYTSKGELANKLVYNEYGRPLFRMDMNIDKENGKGTAAFFRFDGDNTEMLLPLSINQNFKDDNFYVNYSTISKYGYKFDDEGHVKEVRYLGFGSIPTTDQYGIGGIKYDYDDRGLITHQQYIDVKGKPTFNHNGLSIREYEYDDLGRCTELRLLSIDKGPSHIGNHCPVIRYEYDNYGNMLSETYFDLKGKPIVRTDGGMHSLVMEYDDKGNNVARKYYDKKGKLVENNHGVAIEAMEYNGDGFGTKVSYFDAKENPTISHSIGCSSVELVPGPTGLFHEMRLYDEKGKPFENTEGVFLTKTEYDDYGNIVEQKFYDKNESPMNVNGLYHRFEREYDENNNCVLVAFYDKKGKRATSDGVVSILRMEYNPWGAVTAINYFNTDDKPTRNSNLLAGRHYEYSPKTGKQIKVTHVDVDGKTPTMSYNEDPNYAVRIDEYDSRGNQNKMVFNDASGKELYSVCYENDERGNTLTRSVTRNGKVDGVVVHYKYDDNNNETERWYTNANNRPTNGSNGYHKAKYKYDELGNLTESTFWGTNGQRATDNTGIHKNTYVYDRFGQTVEVHVSDASGRPVYGVTSFKSTYDENGNEIESTWYANDRIAVPTVLNWARRKMAYDEHGNNVKTEYLDKQGRPVEEDGVCKYVRTYDDRNQLVKVESYNRRGLFATKVYKYNPQGSQTEWSTLDSNNRLTDDGKYVIEYKSDGVTPTKMSVYTSSNRLYAYVPWNDKAKEWDWDKLHFMY